MSTLSNLRWGRIIGFGLLGEIATAAVIFSVFYVRSRGLPEADAGEMAFRTGRTLGPALGAIFTFAAAVFATRPLERGVRIHAMLVGVVACLLTVPGLVLGDASSRVLYAIAMALKLVAAWAAGVFTKRSREQPAA